MPQEDVKWALDSLKERAPQYKLNRDYYNGVHRLDFVPADFRRDFAALLRRARLNMCPAVVTAVRDRLKLTGLTGDEDDQTLQDNISAIWRRNRMEQRAGEVHLEALICGDSYVIVWPSQTTQLVTFYPQYAEMVTVEYDEEEPDLIIRAAKWWKMKDGRVALTLYYPEVIENYETRGKVQGELKENSFEEAAENPTVLNQYGRVPVFHFGNSAPVGGFGVSELHDAIAVQDGLNKTIRDMLIGGENMSLPQRWATGLEASIDPATGQPVNSWRPGDFWVARNEEAKFGQLDAANLDQLLKVKDGYKEDMALVTGTPVHYFSPGGGTPPSGEALKTIEFRLASKVEDRQTCFGNVWEEAMKFGLQIISPSEVELDAVWRDTTPRNDAEYQDLVERRVEKFGLTKRQGLRELDYVDEEIDRIFEEQAQEKATQPAAPPKVVTLRQRVG